MRKNPRRILSPQRLPFRHSGPGVTNLTNRKAYCNIGQHTHRFLKGLVSLAVSAADYRR